MTILERKQAVPGYRGLLRDIAEAAGPLVLLDELIEEKGLLLVLQAVDMGLSIFTAGGALLAPKGDFQLYLEMLGHIEIDDVSEAIDEIEQEMATA